MKKLLLIYGALYMGGIETLIVRMANEWQRRGIQVKVLLLSRHGDKELLAELERYARVIYLDELLALRALYSERLSLFNWFMPLSEKCVRMLLDGVDHVHFFDSFTMAVSMRLSACARAKVKITGGVYHQYEYAYARLRPNYFVRVFKDMFRKACGTRNVIFFNEVSKRTLADNFGDDYTMSPLLPIGIDLSKAKQRNVAEMRRRKVVSIGRITSFKTYNIRFLHAMKRLNERSLIIDYHIYGDGEDMPALRQAIQQLGLEAQVWLHGPIPYAQFAETVEDCFLFLGSGTALIEAAACGVPALIGIESQADEQTYGFLHTIAGLSYHEKGLPIATRSFDEFVRGLDALDDESYKDVCVSSIAKAREFSMEIFAERFLAADATANIVDGATTRYSKIRFLASMTVDRVMNRSRSGIGFWNRYDAERS